jgi:hypothetical protein
MSQEKTFWGVGAGREGEAIPLFEEKNVVAMGWNEFGNLDDLQTREDF